MKYAKISVLIVTYKQADVIARNIESILQQKDYGLCEIVISDDNSPDNNWEVITRYVNKYPNIIRAYRNSSNLGIYGNSDKLVTMRGEADLFCWLEGDDALCDGFFKNIQSLIIEKDIDLQEKVALFCDWKTITPNGTEYISSNAAVEQASLTLNSLFFRGLATWRGAVFSSKVLDEFKPTKLDSGLNLAETIFDSQFFRYTKKAYYCNFVGAIYYSEIGISTTLDKNSSYRKEEAILKSQYMLANYAVSQSDKMWLSFILYRAKMNVNPTLENFIKALYYYKKGIYTGKGCVKKRFRFYIVPLFARLLRIK